MPAVASAGDVEELLRSRGLRPTRQRVEVLRELSREGNDVTAQLLWQRLHARGEAKVGLATVYRTLALLSEHGVVDVLSHHAPELCYRLCAQRHHHHLLCTECHRVVEIDECGVGGWVDDVAARHGFVAADHRVEISGRCADCQSSNR